MTASTRAPDYVAIGHLAVDRTPEGELLGGSVLYGALAAARFGARAAVLTSANVEGLAPALRDELATIAQEVEIVTQAATDTTTFTNRYVAGRRQQTLHSWAGLLDLTGLPPLWRAAPAIHLAPIAQEIEPRAVARLATGLLGVTPQGWMRAWSTEHLGQVRATPLRLPRDIVSRLDALVLSADELVDARDVAEEVGRAGLVVITRGARGADVIDRGRGFETRAYPAREVDPTGAGDVFAGVLFAARALGASTAASLRYAAAAAALSVTGRGVLSVPDRDAIEALLADA
jgi:sugar/nucleoside kinase (ribokinase family)